MTKEYFLNFPAPPAKKAQTQVNKGGFDSHHDGLDRNYTQIVRFSV
jgi:hypothetical protein